MMNFWLSWWKSGLLNEDIANRFKVSRILVSPIFSTWVRPTAKVLSCVIKVWDLDTVNTLKPKQLKSQKLQIYCRCHWNIHSDTKRSLAATLRIIKLQTSQYFKSSSCYCSKFRYYVFIFSLPRLNIRQGN